MLDNLTRYDTSEYCILNGDQLTSRGLCSWGSVLDHSLSSGQRHEGRESGFTEWCSQRRRYRLQWKMQLLLGVGTMVDLTDSPVEGSPIICLTQLHTGNIFRGKDLLFKYWKAISVLTGSIEPRREIFNVSHGTYAVLLPVTFLVTEFVGSASRWQGLVCHLMCNFGFRGQAESNVDNYPKFRQTLQLPSSGWMCGGWALLEALYRAGSRWWVGFDGADWWSGGAE
jgi:hypothetical protein